MKFVKNNIWALVSALVILVLLLLYIPLSSWANELQESMKTRANDKTQADSLDKATAKIPNNGKDGTVQGPIVPEMTAAKKKQNAWMAKQADEAAKIASSANWRGHINDKGEPLLIDRAIPQYLPEMKGGYDGYDYKEVYAKVMPKYYAALVPSAAFPKNADPVAWGQPLTDAAIRAELARSSGAEAVAGDWANAGTGNDVLSDAQRRNALARRANQIKMYVDTTAFQVRSFAGGETTKPDEEQIFYSLVDTWVQWDMTKAIAATNASASNVNTSAVKRLESIAVGPSLSGTVSTLAIARNPDTSGDQQMPAGPDPEMIRRLMEMGRQMGGGATAAAAVKEVKYTATGHTVSGPIFVGAGRAAANTPSQAQQMGFNTGGGQPAGPTGPDYTVSLTGHSPNDRFDLTYVRLTVDVDPAQLNNLINNIYKQSNAYTVLNINLTTVDPIEAASTGYVYGNTQVVQAQILLEAIFFRDWTVPIMPTDVKKSLGLVSDADKKQPQ